MNYRLRLLSVVVVILSTVLSAGSLQAQIKQEPPSAILQLENNSDKNVTICHILAVQKPSNNAVIDLQNSITLAAGKVTTFTVPAGKIQLHVTYCDQGLVQQFNIKIVDAYTVKLAAQESSVLSCHLLLSRGEGFFSLSKYDDALSILAQALKCFRSLKEDVWQAITLNDIGEVYRTQARYGEALVQYEAALAIVQQAKVGVGEGTIRNNIGLVYYAQGNYKEALEQFKVALAIHREVGNRSGEGTTLSNIGEIYRAQGRYPDALVQYKVALPILREVGDRAGEGATLNSIGLAHYAQGRYVEALAQFEAALAIQREMGNYAREGATLNQIGAVYKTQGRYVEALAQFEAALAIVRAVGDLAGEASILNNIGDVYATEGRYDEALAKYKAALAIDRKIGNRAEEGVILNNIGSVYNDLGHYVEALVQFEVALVIQRDLGNRAGEGTVLNNIGGVYHSQGRYSEALLQYDAALVLRREVGDRAGEGTTLNSIGLVYHAQGRYSEALDSYEQALAIRQEIANRAGEGETLNNIGGIYEAQGRYPESLVWYKAALLIVREIGARALEGITLSNIGVVYQAQGRYDEAFAQFEAALLIAQKAGDRIGEGTTFNNIAGVYRAQRRYSEALVQLEAALTIQQEMNDRSRQGTTLHNIGEIYRVQGRYSEAIDKYEAALAIEREIGDRAREGKTLDNIGSVYYAQGLYDKALSNFETALAIERGVGDRAWEGTTLNNIGVVYLAQERFREALVQLEAALEVLQKVGDRSMEGTTFHNIGLLYETQGRNNEALHNYISGLNVLESIRSSAGSDQARTSFVNDYTVAYDHVIALSYQQDEINQAFWYSERGRTRVLLDTLATGQVQLSDNESGPLLAAEQEVYAVRQSAQDTLAKAHAANPPDPTWLAEAEQALKEAEAAYQKVSDEIAARSDQLASLIPGRQKVPQLADIQALLDKDTTLLSYWMLEDKALAFVVTAKDAKIVELPKVTAQTVLSATESLYKWTNKDNAAPKPLRELYQWLIAPLSDMLKTKHIAIIPHQQLHYVPFAALVDESHDNQYFGEQHTLSILPSASVLPFLQDNAKAATANQNGSEVVFGDPASDQPGLSPLHYAEQEAEAVADILKTKAITTTAATEASLHQSVQGARILHLAAHGEYNQGNALYSSIYLAPLQSVTPTQALTEAELLPTVDTSLDGRLETHEIFGLPLKGNDLVVLSACQTNVGDLSRGDEIVGLTRAFFFAGSPTVISSLWNVDDAATETLMVSFYKHWLKEDMSKAEALQAAQSDVRSNARWMSPFYWAGFVLNGDPGTQR